MDDLICTLAPLSTRLSPCRTGGIWMLSRLIGSNGHISGVRPWHTHYTRFVVAPGTLTACRFSLTHRSIMPFCPMVTSHLIDYCLLYMFLSFCLQAIFLFVKFYYCFYYVIIKYSFYFVEYWLGEACHQWFCEEHCST